MIAVGVVAAVVVAVAVSRSSTVSGQGGSRPLGSSATDVVFVHGAGCTALPFTTEAIHDLESLTGRSATTFHTVAYYACDSGGDSIVNEGSSSYLPSTDDNGVNTDIRRISYELAWYLWNDFGSKGKAVDLVGHSMGGIVIAYALQRIAAHDPAYPSALTVNSVTTFSSPFDGVSPSLCATGQTAECTQLLTGSSLLSQISSAGAVTLGPKTVWTLVGSDGADAIPTTSSLALPGVTYRVDYQAPAYTHTSYLVDPTPTRSARGLMNGGEFLSGYHSLELLAHLLT